ncbi:alginate lyase family protein [Paenibacillus sp. FSL F4-0087]|uniref:alginate lyase family protein n=1 Tax=Paenibacillus sp. FSL F4-0087 TaxID=2921368 RepID=UPI00096C21F7|nr:hypothetical protein BK122_03315 [Paenibacillus pabuli]
MRFSFRNRGTYVATTLLLVVALATAVGIKLNEMEKNAIANNFDSEIQQYVPIFMTDGITSDEQYIDYADALLNDNLFVNDKINSGVQILYNIDNIDWNISATKSPNTFSLYLQTLRPIYYLSKAYTLTSDDKYLDAADKFVLSWGEYAQSKAKLNRYTWYDHSVAERVENLIYLSKVEESVGNKLRVQKLDILIQNNSEWLYDDTNYTKNHNHGIFQDGALIKAGYYLENNNYVEKGIERLDKQLQYAFPNKHVHIENSTGYHVGIISYIKGISEFLSSSHNVYAEIANSYYKGALEYLVYVYKPNLSIPLIGDTLGTFTSNNPSIINSFNDHSLEYIFSKGFNGTQPEYNTRLFQNDGTIIFREYWDSNKYDQSTWALFKSGYSSSTHKHADDLSFLLYSKGHDIFIDPGMYNYMVGDPIYDYINSNSAHNTIVVDGKSYSISMFNSKKVGIYSYSQEEGYESVTGFNNIFPGVKIDRTINYLDGNNIIIHDDIVSEKVHDYSQVFHLSNDTEIKQLTPNRAILKIKDTNYYVLLDQLANVDQVKKNIGQNEDNNLSVISSGLNQSVPSQSILFKKSGKSTEFVTSIRIINETDLPRYLKQNLNYDGKQVEINDVIVPIKSRERLPESQVEADIVGSNLKIKNSAESYEQELSYSYYLIDKVTGEKFTSSSYSGENHEEFHLEKGYSYAVISYLRNKAKETTKKIVGFVEYEGNKFIYKPISTDQQEPIVSNNHIMDEGNNSYKFTIDLSNFYGGVSSRWYVYKDGASYDFINNKSNEFRYKFVEPGEYTVIYRINDKYFGEVEYNHFEKIQITSWK